jgi:hypothetical protein
MRRCLQMMMRRRSMMMTMMTTRNYSTTSEARDIFHTKTSEEWKDFFRSRENYGVIKHMNFEFVSMEYKKLVAKVSSWYFVCVSHKLIL